jgi:hypothetical protein
MPRLAVRLALTVAARDSDDALLVAPPVPADAKRESKGSSSPPSSRRGMMPRSCKQTSKQDRGTTYPRSRNDPRWRSRAASSIAKRTARSKASSGPSGAPDDVTPAIIGACPDGRSLSPSPRSRSSCDSRRTLCAPWSDVANSRNSTCHRNGRSAFRREQSMHWSVRNRRYSKSRRRRARRYSPGRPSSGVMRVVIHLASRDAVAHRRRHVSPGPYLALRTRPKSTGRSIGRSSTQGVAATGTCSVGRAKRTVAANRARGGVDACNRRTSRCVGHASCSALTRRSPTTATLSVLRYDTRSCAATGVATNPIS